MTNNNQQNILNEGTQRDQGKTAQRMNILAAKLVAETVRTTLGPQGMDKMIVDGLGDVVITNDGATILKEMNIEHPTAKMIVEIAKTQETEVGDGTTTAVVLAGELLRRAEELIEQNIHPTVVIKGYRLAAKTAQSVLENMAEDINEKETNILKNISSTSITGKVAENAKDYLSTIIVNAIKQVQDESIELENIKLETKTGNSIKETELIKGIVLDKEKTHNNMPEKIEKAKVALIDSALEVQSTDTDAKISITDPSKLQEFLDMEENMLRKVVDNIVKSGANVVFCQKGIDDFVQYLLAQKGIYACRRVKKSDLKKIARATAGTIITNVKDLTKEHLGSAGEVFEMEINDEKMTVIGQCKNPKAVTILIRASTEHLVEEVKRAIEDALGTVASALRAKKIVAGAGAVEMELARNIRHYSAKLSGKEQLAIEAFATAMEIIPKTLSENAGLDPIDMITDLKSDHDKGQKWSGIDVYTGKTIDAMKKGIIEPLTVKTQAIQSASEVAVMILRIDDVIVAGNETPAGASNPGEGYE